jgi:hypothetical protein
LINIRENRTAWFCRDIYIHLALHVEATISLLTTTIIIVFNRSTSQLGFFPYDYYQQQHNHPVITGVCLNISIRLSMVSILFLLNSRKQVLRVRIF